MSHQLAELIGSTAREARTQAGLTRHQVAEAIGLAPVAYARLERGRLLPSVPTLCRLAQVLKIATDLLLGMHTATPGLER